MSAHPQATDDDSPPNNILTYTITSISAFPSHFSIIMVEGYAGIAHLNEQIHSFECDIVCRDTWKTGKTNFVN